jgi:hypothetical protein
MSKIKVMMNIKEKRKDNEFDKENGWNNRFNAYDRSPIGKIRNFNHIGKNFEDRQSSSKLKIKTDGKIFNLIFKFSARAV